MPKILGSIGGKMFSTSDLLPQNSGSASIGVNTNGLGAETTTIKPYAHIHQNSGVFHARGGGSGLLRFAMKDDLSYASAPHDGETFFHAAGIQSLIEVSTDGGINYPLRIGGTKFVNDGENGDVEIAVIRTQDSQNNDMLIYSSGKMQVIGGHGLDVFAFPQNLIEGVSIYSPVTSIDSSEQTHLRSQGPVDIQGGINGYRAGSSSDFGDVSIQAFQGSGYFHYRNNVPYESWYMRATSVSQGVGGPFSNGEWPIAHSGNINEMINRAIKTKGMTIERPVLNNDLTFWYTNEAITIHEVESVVRGAFDASGQFAIRYGADRSLAGTELTTNTINCTNRTVGQITTSFAAPNIPADNWIWVGVSGVSGTVTSQLSLTIQYK